MISGVGEDRMSNLNCTLRFNASGGRYGSGDEYEANIYSKTYTEGSDPFELYPPRRRIGFDITAEPPSKPYGKLHS